MDNVTDQTFSSKILDTGLVKGSRKTFWLILLSVIAGLISPLGLIWAGMLAYGKKFNHPKLAALTLVISILSAAVYVYAFQHYQQTNNYNYRYSSLDNVQLSSGNIPGVKASAATITFQKPTQFTDTTNNKTFLSNYQHKLKEGSSSRVVGDLAVSVAQVTGKLPDIYPPYLSKVFSGSTSETEYKIEAKGLLAFAIDQLPKNLMDVRISNVRSFTNPYIKSNAWIFDVDAKSNVANAQSWHGQLLYAWGKHGFYHLLLATINQNWQPNQTVWQRVLQSAKVD